MRKFYVCFVLQSQNPTHMNSFHGQGCFGGKAWEGLVEGPLPLGSFWENKSMLTSCEEGTFTFPCQNVSSWGQMNLLASVHPAQKKYLKERDPGSRSLIEFWERGNHACWATVGKSLRGTSECHMPGVGLLKRSSFPPSTIYFPPYTPF